MKLFTVCDHICYYGNGHDDAHTLMGTHHVGNTLHI